MKDGIKEITFHSDRVKYWLSVGAQPSDRVNWLLAKVGLFPPTPVRQSVKHLLPKALQPEKKK